MMNRISNLLVYKGQQIEKQNMIWNMAGSFCYAFASMVLSFLVIRIAGEDAGGVFAVGFSAFGQQMFTLAYFGLRPFQITDGGTARGGYSFGEYRFHRKITCILAVAVSVIYVVWMREKGIYGGEKAFAIFLLAVYKIIDGYADVYESEFQRQGSLYLTGKSNTFRTILSVSAFVLTLAATRELVPACILAVIAQILGVVIFDFTVTGTLREIDYGYRSQGAKRLTAQSGLLFLSVFLDFYVFSAAKYAIDGWMNDAASGYFNLIFMPTSVIYLVANFVIRPFLTRLTACWNQGETGEFRKILKKIGVIILGLSVLAVGGCIGLGRLVLSVMEHILGSGYEGSLVQHHLAFTVIVFGGGVYALTNLMYYSLVIMRQQRWIFTVYLGTAASAFVLAPFFVSRIGILGGAFAYCLFMLMQLTGFGVGVLPRLYRQKGKRR